MLRSKFGDFEKVQRKVQLDSKGHHVNKKAKKMGGTESLKRICTVGLARCSE